MLDFLRISKKSPRRGLLEVYPSFLVEKTHDLMIRGGDFYAIWDEENQLWTQDEYRAIKLIDNEVRSVYNQDLESGIFDGQVVNPLYLTDFDSGMADKWHKYVQKGLRDNYVPLDETIIFANQKTTRQSYASHKLPYSLDDGPCEAWDELVSTLYSEEERHKIEWTIGAIAKGESKKLQKFIVFYGSGGTGKSTILHIIEKLFVGYTVPFDAKALGMSNNTFALEPFSSNPLVAIDHDSKLDRIEDNTRINSLVSHERMTVNEKHKKLYQQAFNSILLIGTNSPVKITDSKSGLIRRLIDISPTGKKIPRKRYDELLERIDFELGAIANHCIKAFEDNPGYYDEYVPINMLGSTNHMYDFILEEYDDLSSEDGITLSAAWDKYKRYCETSNIIYPMNRLTFKEELKNYYKDYKDRIHLNDGNYRSYYIGFLKDKFISNLEKSPDEKTENQSWIKLDYRERSVLDIELADCYAQYATPDEKPKKKWSEVTQYLKDLRVNRLHYIRVPVNHIVIDFDLKDEDGKKNLELNIQAANKFPPTYAEVSKGGEGLHLHYIYTGDVEELDSNYDKDIEVKVFTGNSSLRRRLSLCNDMPVSTISSGLPLRKEKKNVLDNFVIKNERQLRNAISKNLIKGNVSSTNQSVSLIEKDLNNAYASGIPYNVTDLRPDILRFAEQSTNHKDECRRKVRKMKFKSEDEIENNVVPFPEDSPIIFFDVEVFPNLFVICWKRAGSSKIQKMINPNARDVRKLYSMRLVGFNNRRYDNHIIFASGEGYTNKELFDVSQRIINGMPGGFFGQAYNLSYTDIYDFASAANKKSLKKFEIELGIHHQELGLDWNEPVPEDMWETVADYCCNDVIATEAVWEHLKDDFAAREMLVELANGLCPTIRSTVNDTTNTLSTRIIFGTNRSPQSEFNYRDLAEPVKDLPDDVKRYLKENTYVDIDKGFEPDWVAGEKSILPYFPGYKYDPKEHESMYRDTLASEGGYVYSQPGIWYDVGLMDVESMHPSSTEDECLFGVLYSKRFSDIKKARVKIKHEDFNGIEEFLDGALVPISEKIKSGELSSEALSTALKTVINSVYGLTKAGFENPFKDPRNDDNIVAKRGALFMIDLQKYCESKGYTVVHIKTDSIKLANVNKEMIDDVMAYGMRYGYKFEHEATYERMCLVNKAVYVAKYADEQHCMDAYGYVPSDNKKHAEQWTATGDQFKVPYVFKSLFSHEEIEPRDLMEVFNVKTALYLDYNECLKEDEHDYHFIGRTGAFYPIAQGRGGAELRVKRGESYNYPSGAKGYRWLESETVDKADLTGYIDLSYWDTLLDKAKEAISEHGDLTSFLGAKFPADAMNPPEAKLEVA